MPLATGGRFVIPSPLDIALTRTVAAAFLVAMMLSMGLTLGGQPKEEKHAKRRKRRLLFGALVYNLALLPLIALALTHLFRVNDDVAVALLLVAASPGGRFAPQLAKLAGADLGLSVEITLFLAKLVSFTAPVTVRWMLHTHHLELHELPFILQLLLLQLAPYLVGRQLRARRATFAAHLQRPVQLAMWASLALLVVLVVTRLHGVAAILAARGWLPVAAFALTAPLLGWLVGGVAAGTRRSFAVSSNARDLALAAMLASLGFAGSHVPVATLAVWLLLLLVDLAFVFFVARRGGRAAPVARESLITG